VAAEDSDPPSQGDRSHVLLGAGALVAAGIVVAVGLTRGDSSSTSTAAACTEASIADVWNDEVATALASTMAASEVSFATSTFTTVRHDLDDYAQTWTAARDEVCVADDHTATDDRRDAVLACLQLRERRLAALVLGLQQADALAIDRSWRASASLPPIADCGDAPRVPASNDPALPDRLDAAAVMIELGRLDAAALALDAIVLPDDEPHAAHRLLLRGLLLAERGLVAEAIAELESATWRSIALDDPQITFRAATSLARLVSLSPLENASALRWWQLASAVASRLAPSPLRQHELLTVRAMLLHRAGEQRGALALYEPALALGEQSFGSGHPLLLEGLTAAAIAAAEIGEPDLGEQMAIRALDIAMHALGRTHPEAAEVARAFGTALVGGGHPMVGASWLEKAVDIRGEAASPDEGVRLRLELGKAWAAAGESGKAREVYVQAGRWLDDHGGDPMLRAEVELGLATALRDAGEAGASIDHLRAAVAAHADAPEDGLAIRVQLGRALRDATRLDEARTELTAAVADSIAAYGENDPRVGDAELALADVALASGAADEALELARKAVKVFVEARGAEDPSVHLALTQLGAACLALDRDSDAVAAFERAVAVGKAAGIDAPTMAESQLSLASALWRVGEEERAEEFARAARITAAEAQPPDGITAAAIDDWFDRRSLDPQG
jgi:tetratricopeptide (TPR) repeat protein